MKTTRVGLLRISLIFAMILFSFPATVWTDEVKVFTNMAEWNHPVKEVFRKHKVEIYKVELRNNKTYPIFYVKFPYDPTLGHNNSYFTPLYYETLKANGFWDYAFIDLDSNSRINIRWNKKTKTLSEDQVKADQEMEIQGHAGPSPPSGTDSGALPPPPPLPD